MLRFILENHATIIAGIVVFAIVAAVIVKMVRDKRNNKSSCGCSCSGCPGAGKCGHGQ